VVLLSLAVVHAAVDPRDLHRAKTKVPRPPFKGETPHAMGEALNRAMKSMFPNTKPCEQWTADELQAYQTQLYKYRHQDFDSIYQSSADNRRLLHGSLDAYQAHWAKVNQLVKPHEHLHQMHRDGHCHEAVMWLIHHVPAADQQTVFARQMAPLLPLSAHDGCGPDASQDELEVCRVYEAARSCADCHSGSGIPMQDYNDPDGVIPEDPNYPGWARQRRCDQDYLPKCGPCEGVGGPYWGDAVKDFQPTNCEVVSLPEDVPVGDRLKPEFAEQFIVHQLGSDRLARTQNAAKYAFYSQIRSTLWYDFPLGGESNGTAVNGDAKLRHDTFYDDLAEKWLDNGLVTEVHLQNREQRDANVTGPMVSLLHGLLGYGKYLGGLTCLADPVGVPVLAGRVDVNGTAHSSFMDGADYKGRIRIGVEYDGFKMGDTGSGDMKAKRNMTVDHYVKWFLHIFVDADKNSPTYNQPVRFYGPYSGFAVYITYDKVQPPAEVWDTACVGSLNGWPTNESKPLFPCLGKKIKDYPCMVVGKTHPEVCDPWVNDTGAAVETLADVEEQFETFKGAFGTVRIPLSKLKGQ